MGGRVRRIDKEVIHVDNEPSFCNYITKGVIHELSEGGRGIDEAEEHYSWFEESFMSHKSSFPLISVLDLNIVISPLDIKFGEDLCPWSLSTRSEMSGRRYASQTVCSLM